MHSLSTFKVPKTKTFKHKAFTLSYLNCSYKCNSWKLSFLEFLYTASSHYTALLCLFYQLFVIPLIACSDHNQKHRHLFRRQEETDKNDASFHSQYQKMFV